MTLLSKKKDTLVIESKFYKSNKCDSLLMIEFKIKWGWYIKGSQIETREVHKLFNSTIVESIKYCDCKELIEGTYWHRGLVYISGVSETTHTYDSGLYWDGDLYDTLDKVVLLHANKHSESVRKLKLRMSFWMYECRTFGSKWQCQSNMAAFLLLWWCCSRVPIHCIFIHCSTNESTQYPYL